MKEEPEGLCLRWNSRDMIEEKQRSVHERLENLTKGFELCLEVMKAMEKV